MNGSMQPSEVLPCFEPEDLGLRPEVIPTRELAEILGVSETRLRQLVAVGLPRLREGQWPLVACVRWYVRRLQTELAQVSDTGLKKSRQQLAMYKAEREKMKLQKERGELIEIGLFRKVIGNAFSVVRERLLMLPGRTAWQLAGSNREAIESRLTSEVHDVLTSLSQMPTSALLEGVDSGETANPRENALQREKEPILEAEV